MSIFTRLKTALGFAPPVLALPTRAPAANRGGRVVGDLPLYLQIQRIGGGVTPAQISNILAQADNGYMWQLVDLANEARQKDGHLQCVLQTRELGVASLDWQILPWCAKGKTEPRKRDRDIAEFVSGVVQDLAIATTDNPIGDFGRLVKHLTGGVFYGYANAEILWGVKGGAEVPLSFQCNSPRRFIFDLATGTLKWWDASGVANIPYPGVDVYREYPGKFIQYQPRVTGDVPAREGLIRVLMWAALFRNWDVRDWLQLAELAWKPYRMGAYDKGASQEDIDGLEAILASLTTSNVAVYPKTTEVKVEWPKNATKTSTHKELFETFGAEMSKAVLGQTLTTEQGARGSQALGRVHDNIRRDILEADARDIAAVLTRDLIAPLVRKNFGPDAKIPQLAFLTEDPVDLMNFSSAVGNLKKAGLKIPARWVRDIAGMPEPAEGDEILGDDVDIPIDPATGLPAEPDGDEPKDDSKADA